MATELISAVSLGESLQVGTCTISNAAQGAQVGGIGSLRVGQSLVSSALRLTFDFSGVSSEWLSRLDFTPLIRPITRVGGFDASQFGGASVVNTAQGATTQGVNSLRLGLAWVSYSGTSGLTLNFSALSDHALPLFFPFSGGRVIPIRGINEPGFGQASAKTRIEVRPSGFDTLRLGNNLRIHNNPVLNLVLSTPGDSALALQFNFGGAKLVAPSDGAMLRMGWASIRNAAQAAWPAGLEGPRPSLAHIGKPSDILRLDFNAVKGHIAGALVRLTFAGARDVAPSGVRPPVFYGPTLTYATPTLLPSSIEPPPVTVPNIAYGAPKIAPGGIYPPPQTGPNGNRQIPDPWISYRIRYLTPGGIAVPTNQIATTHVIAFDIQFIDLAGRGPNPWVTGNARIEYTVRYIEPPFIASNIFGSHNVARIQVAAPTGWESSFISENHEFDINLQRIIVPTGEADPAGYGVTHVRNQFEVLRLTGWLSQNINFPIVYNLDQYLFVQPYMGTNSDPTQWPNWAPWVENRTRYLAPGGWRSSRFSVIGNIVKNTAAPLLPPGLDATLWGPETFIAHRIRHVGPEGWDNFYNTRYTVIFNNAVVLAPQGWDSAQVGTPEQVINFNRTVKHIFPYGGETVGTAFIAYRVRTVYPSLFYDVPSGFPEVRFNPYPISPVGIDSYRTGGHTVYEHFTIVYPKSANVHAVPWVGEPIVENRNKTLRVFPSDQSLYGLAKVFNYNTHLTITAGDLTVWGSHLISYRTRTITAAPISVPVFSVTHRIRNVLPDPPSRQLVEPNGLNPGIVPSPGIRLATIYPKGINEEGYGQPKLTRNTIEVPPGPFNLDQVGVPTLIFTQYCSPRGIPWPREGFTNPDGSMGESDLLAHQARPRVTPHTIYAPSADQATRQAMINHPGNMPYPIDASAWFGRPDVSNQHRVIGPAPNHNSGNPPGLSPATRYGSPTLTLSRQYVYPTPIRSLRFGLIMFLDVPQYVNLDSLHNGIAPLNAFGQHTVAPPPVVVSPEAKPSGFVATLWGTHRVELFIREVLPSGIPHRGNPQQGLTNPWGLPLIGFPRKYVVGGFEATLWGTHRVEYRIRNLYPEGWDSFADTLYDFSRWADRMRVVRRNPPGGVLGIPSAAEFGHHLISFSIRTIPSRGILGYNSGDHIVKSASFLLPAGWDSLEVGDIDRWEAGKIKPHGDDLSIMGTPRMLSPLRPSGLADGAVGSLRVGVPIRLMGIPEIGFAGPSVSNPFGCTNRVVTPLPVLSQQNVPQPVVTL